MSSPIVYRFIEYRTPIYDQKTYKIIEYSPWKAAYVWNSIKPEYLYNEKFNQKLLQHNPNNHGLYKYGHFADTAWGYGEFLKENANGFPIDGDPELYNFITSDGWISEEKWGPSQKITYIDPQTQKEKELTYWKYKDLLYKKNNENSINKTIVEEPTTGDLIKINNNIISITVTKLPTEYYDFRYNKGYITGKELAKYANKKISECKEQIKDLETELKLRTGTEILLKLAQNFDISTKDLPKSKEFLNDWTISDLQASIEEYKEDLELYNSIYTELYTIQKFIELSGGPSYIDNENFRIIYWFC